MFKSQIEKRIKNSIDPIKTQNDIMINICDKLDIIYGFDEKGVIYVTAEDYETIRKYMISQI